MTYIKELISLGVLIDPDANDRLKTLNETDIIKIIAKTKEDRPLVLTSEIINNYLKSTSFKILKNMKKVKKISVQDLIDVLNKRYDFTQELLMKKVELSNIISINKCSNGKVSVIGMVKSKEPSNGNMLLELEDKTGSVRVIVDRDVGEKVSLDDIVAASGSYNNKILFGEKIVYPDVPLRKVSYSELDTKVAFIINHDFENKIDINADYVFVGNCDNVEKIKEHYPRTKFFIVSNEEKTDGNLNYIVTPVSLEIDGVNILVLFDSDPLTALKKRFVNINSQDFLIDTAPDIVLTNKEISANYKSISIVGEKCLIELKNRNIIKI
ncbi:MAG: hypothetical protein PHU12_00805 [Candidatus Aenigmarchaeota archaeon]|nr:hypothetical protein [Candidatus Aenigmarchaeota archaeon]